MLANLMCSSFVMAATGFGEPLSRVSPNGRKSDMPTELKPCPCGATPTALCLEGDSPAKWMRVSGDCCNEWSIEFRSSYERDPEKLHELGAKAWNASPRATV